MCKPMGLEATAQVELHATMPSPELALPPTDDVVLEGVNDISAAKGTGDARLRRWQERDAHMPTQQCALR